MFHDSSAPSQLLREIVNLLNREVARAFQSPELMQRLAALGAELATGQPEAFDAQMRREVGVLKELVRTAGIPLAN